MNSFIPWVGGKSKLLWIINKMAPDHYSRFIDVFGGSGTVTMSRPIQQGCMEVYNDFNSNLTNLFCCVKNRPLALLAELGFLPLNTRDDFNVLYKFLSKGEITDDYLQEEMELTEILLKPPEAEAIRTLLLERAPRGDVRRAADFFKLVRYSFSGSSKSFGGKPCDIRRFFHLIWECSRRLANVIVENKDFEDVIRQYDRGDAWIYCDPPYFEAECYEVAFPKENHQRLHDTLLNCHGYVMVSYNYCPYICELYQEFYIFRVVRPNSMSQTAGSEYEEVKLKHQSIPILEQMLTSLQLIRNRKMLWSPDIVALNKRISDLSSQNQTLAFLKQQGLVDPDIFIAKTNELTKQLRQAKLEKEKLMDAESDMTALQTRDLIDILEDGPEFLDSFDTELFGELVEKIIIESNDSVRFCLKNGLELRESIERTVR